MPRPPASSAARSSGQAAAPALGRRGGFALLITITLLAFLVLLLVSLSSMTRVETQVTTNSQSLVQARQNALLALNVALGQLQKYAGPDQRVTAEADISSTLTRQPNCRWTGVYGSAVAGNYSEAPENIQSDLTDATKVNASTGSQAQLLTWLVSGNEPAPFDPATDVGASGQIVNVPASSSIPFQPSQAVGNLTVGASATVASFTINNQPAELLVGPGTANTDVPLTGSSTSTPVDYVVAPLVNITASGVPGVGNATVGRYAWWVGDEGVKARVNLPLVSAAANATVQNNAFVTPTRDAIELMAGLTGNSTAAGGPVTQSNAAVIGAGYDVSRATSLLDGNQLPLLNTGNATLGIFTRNRFHDLTGCSYSVLSDTYAGGLKKDLTRLLLDPSMPAVTDPVSTSGAVIGPTSELFAPSSSGGIDSYIPTWGILRNWAQLATAADGTISPQLPATTTVGGVPIPTQASISPVLTYFSLGFRYATNGPVADGAAVQVNLYPIVVLWNPYTVPLAAHVYEVGIAPAPWQNSLTTWLQNSPDGSTWTTIANTTCNFTQITGTTGKNEYIIFRVDCPQIAPGQSLIFSLPSSASGSAYTNIGANAPKLENEVPDPRYYVVKSLAGTIPTGQSGYSYRVTSTTFANGSGGTVYMYLGEPSSNPATTNFDSNALTSNQNLYSTTIPKQWYQTNQNIGWDTISVPKDSDGASVNQAGLSFADDTAVTPQGPAFVVYGQAIFSGGGSNANIDYGGTNQMFTRWIAQGNMRAPITARTRLDNNYNVLYAANAGPNSGNSVWQHFTMGAPTPAQASAGLGHDWVGSPLAPANVSLFEVRSNSQPNFLSIGQLQHAPLSTIGAYPSYAIGNSLSDFRLNGNTVVNSSPYTGGSVPVSGAGLSYLQKAYYDVSWLLNRSLWDHYYFSTIPSSASGQTAVPANPRLVACDSASAATLQDANNAASGLLVAGGFNINSTSIQAWRAILAGAYLPSGSYTPPGLSASTAGNIPFSRFARPFATNSAAAENNANDPWEGYRTLTQLQITTLAQNIVAQVRAYGPFVSLADFVNRRLVNTKGLTTSTPAANPLGLKGPLQAAIDAQTTSSANPNSTNAVKAINDSSTAFWNPNNPAIAGNYNGQPYFVQNGWGTLVSTAAATTSPVSNRSAYSPQYLTQADLLSALGPILSARSDTFRIRTYGETRNPVTQAVTGRAWCEAIVQRVPDYVDPADAAANPPATTLNKSFGRQFKVVSFRWLSPSDI